MSVCLKGGCGACVPGAGGVVAVMLHETCLDTVCMHYSWPLQGSNKVLDGSTGATSAGHAVWCTCIECVSLVTCRLSNDCGPGQQGIRMLEGGGGGGGSQNGCVMPEDLYAT